MTAVGIADRSLWAVGLKPLARYSFRLKSVVSRRKPARFPVLIDEAIRFVTRQEPSDDDIHRSYQPVTPPHDRRHAYASTRSKHSENDPISAAMSLKTLCHSGRSEYTENLPCEASRIVRLRGRRCPAKRLRTSSHRPPGRCAYPMKIRSGLFHFTAYRVAADAKGRLRPSETPGRAPSRDYCSLWDSKFKLSR
jgi:hypothetical protein